MASFTEKGNLIQMGVSTETRTRLLLKGTSQEIDTPKSKWHEIFL